MKLKLITKHICVSSKGFTLIELLVFMAVLSIVATFILMTFPNALAKARDDKRIKDLRQFQLALDNYQARSNGFYLAYHNGTPLISLCGASSLNVTPCPTDDSYRYQSNGAPDGSSTATAWVISTGNLEIRISSTTYHYIICSNGQSGRTTQTTFANGNCPGGLLP